MRVARRFVPWWAGAVTGLLASAVLAASGPSAIAAGSCVHATIGGKRVCLVAGRPCRLRYSAQYRRQGFSCRRNDKGEYRLYLIRHSIGTPAV